MVYPEVVERFVAEAMGSDLWTFPSWWSPAAFVTSRIEELCRFGIAVMRHVFVPPEVLYGEMLQDYGSERGFGWVVRDTSILINVHSCEDFSHRDLCALRQNDLEQAHFPLHP